MWNNMGFSQKLVNKPSLALGTSNASIYELAIAYASFANSGYKIKPQSIISIKTTDGTVIYSNKMLKSKKQVLSRESATLMNTMLQKAL